MSDHPKPEHSQEDSDREDAYEESYQEDLNPNFEAGQNEGVSSPHPGKADNVATAYDIKNLHNRLQGFTDDELKAIPVTPGGARLAQGAVYIDLRESEPQEFTARGDMEAGYDNWFVRKNDVDYVLWNRLIGVDNPERLDEADES